ncbi:hypothetical protein N7495_000578 [Penicillium taxi]|uniref:uncharacterized protein n=1 Tax=Penicillium taxi TaxID=168475 RepID=UPI0025455EA4|nr:uncharacterized protein N7495_000578 [Penicillium taxi]KAJ5907896.1 hypothetical protein N7495_000578 [Penicillium taxi]
MADAQESRAQTVKAAMWVMTAVSIIFVSLRLYVRLFLRHLFGWDDFIIIVATGFLIAYTVVCHIAADLGLGSHLVSVEKYPQNLITAALLCDIGESMAIMACTLGKTSFALTLLRIVVHRWMVFTLWFVIITMNIVNILAALFVFLQCKDPRHLWDASIPSECWPSSVFTHFSLFVGAYSGAQDFVLALLPWTIVWSLQMKRKEKVGIAVAMSLGIFAGAAAIVKTTYLVALSAKADFTWEIAPLLWWAAIEDGLAITAASIPALKPLLSKVFPSSSAGESDESYKMLNLPVSPSKRKIYDNYEGATVTDIGHLTDNDGESQTTILDLSPFAKKEEAIKMRTEVSVTYNQQP